MVSLFLLEGWIRIMNLPPVDELTKTALCNQLHDLEKLLDGDVISFTGQIMEGTELTFSRIIEELAEDKDKHDVLYIILTTPGGSAIAVERYVNIIRQHYKIVNFIVSDYAYSAGTIFCMSGDDIYMDYYSVLGPIDPQVQNRDGNFVAALGYLDKVNELVEKARNNTLTQAEFLILREIDLAELRSYEQAKELTIDLLKKWLVKYKFKNWTEHQTNSSLKGQPVSYDEKRKRAEEIADKLSDNNIWKSHARSINIEVLEKELRLKIHDYTNEHNLRNKIRNYYLLLNHYLQINRHPVYIHTRRFM